MPSQTIDITFIRAGKKGLLYRGNFSYRSAYAASDQLEISNKAIVIRMTRSSNTQNPLRAHNSTIFKQLTKALCLYYILERAPNQIKEIRITRIKAGEDTSSEIVPKDKVRQIVARSANLNVLGSINPAKAPLLLSETPAGRAVLYASTHLIKALDSSSPFDRFEKLWRAFNALYKALTKKSSDYECHVALREYMQNNPAHFPLSLAMVKPLSTAEIRNNIRWNQMILNNHPTQAKTGALKDSVLRNLDSRILEIYQASLPIRQDFLTLGGMYVSVFDHISNGISANVTRDSDVLSTLCIKYMYFVRNKIAHAEKADHGFSFLHGSTDESEIRWLAPFLEALVIDLINMSDTF